MQSSPDQIPAEMDTADLAKLERIARNLPITSKVTLANAGTGHGMIYMAWGTDAMGVYHGIWGARGVAEPLEFTPETRNPDTVRDALMVRAAEVMNGMAANGMFHKGWWHAGRA